MSGRLTLGSLFDGSGGFPLGGLLCGIVPLWASEIEPFPIRVTSKRLPFMRHLGDIRGIDGGKIEPVDIVTFGSPCQDMSIAGKRSGLSGSRSNLFYEAIRVITEMRCATNGKFPKYAVWENVPGAFSSNKGEDFRRVLESLCKIKDGNVSIPQPEKWSGAGEIVGNGFSIAWRTLDAQYWGVPQRRRRIFLVADFNGECAGKILFEPEGVSAYSGNSKRAWKTAPGIAEKGFGEAIEFCLNDQGGERLDITDGFAGTLRAQSNHPPIVFEKTKCFDVRFTSEGTKNARQNCYETETSRTIDSGGNRPDGNQGGVAVVAVEGNGARPSHHGSGFSQENKMYTLNATEQHAVAYGIGREAFNQGQNAQFSITVNEERQPTIVAKGPGAVAHHIPETAKYIVRRLTPTECARLQGFPDWWCDNLASENPSNEEIKLWQGIFEEHRKALGKPGKSKSAAQVRSWLKRVQSDSAEYRMWGNGVALPCVAFVLAGIVHYSQPPNGNIVR